MQGSPAYNLREEREEGRTESEPEPVEGQRERQRPGWGMGKGPSFPAERETGIPPPLVAWQHGELGRDLAPGPCPALGWDTVTEC